MSLFGNDVRIMYPKYLHKPKNRLASLETVLQCGFPEVEMTRDPIRSRPDFPRNRADCRVVLKSLYHGTRGLKHSIHYTQVYTSTKTQLYAGYVLIVLHCFEKVNGIHRSGSLQTIFQNLPICLQTRRECKLFCDSVCKK